MKRSLRSPVFVVVLLSIATACDDERNGNSRTSDVQLAKSSGNHFDVDVASDGRIAYATPVDGAAAVFVADVSGENPRKITSGVWDFYPRWSPDGKLIAFNRETNTQDVVVVPAAGGPERIITSDPNFETVIGWMPDGSGVVYGRIAGSTYETWVYSLADSSRRRLVEDTGGVFAIPSPDGKWIAYESIREGMRTIRAMNLVTGERKQLTTDGYEQLPIEGRLWSHDSERIAYVTTRTGTTDIWVANVVNGQLKQLTRDVRDDNYPVYEPKGNRIAFQSTRGGQPDVWIVADTGGEEVRITDDVALESGSAWTADGDALIITGTDARSRLYSVATAGGEVTTLTDDASNARNFTITPDGTRIVYERDQGGDFDIYSMPVTGGEPTLVVSSPARDVMPMISPDGSKVLFASDRTGEADVFVVPLAGGEPRQLTNWNSREDDPRWSPDGSNILFRSNREGQSDLWMMDSAGGNKRKLTSGSSILSGNQWSPDGTRIAINGASFENSPGIQLLDVKSGKTIPLRGKFLGDPWWSPTDSLIAVANLSDGFGHIELFTTSGEKVKRLTPEGRYYARAPHFSKDGKTLLFVVYDFANDFYDVAVTPVAGGEIRKLSNHRGAMNYYRFTPDGNSVIYSGLVYKPVFYKRPVPR